MNVHNSPEYFLAVVPSTIHISPMFKKFLNVDNISDKCMHLKNNKNDTNKFHYIFSRKLAGTGTFSKVFRAIDMYNIHKKTNKFKAVKVLKKKTKYYDTKLVEREIESLTKLDHPNLIKLDRVIESASKVFLVMEYAFGKDLFKILETKYNNGMEEEMIRNIIINILDALSYCHSVGIAHRDLKPENVMIDEELHIKIVDFGLSSIFGSNMTAKTSCGTLNYFAPEIVSKNEYNAPAVDVWGVGVLTYVCLYVKLPFEGNNIHETYQLIQQGPPDFSEREISDEIKDFILSALCVNPDKRPNITKLMNHPFITGTTTPKQSPKQHMILPKLNMDTIKVQSTPLCVITPHSDRTASIESVGEKSLLVSTDVVQRRYIYTKSGDLPDEFKDTSTPLGRLHMYTNKYRRNSIDYTNIDSRLSPNNTRGLNVNKHNITSDDMMKRMIELLSTFDHLKITISTTTGVICTYKNVSFSIQIKQISGTNIKTYKYNLLEGPNNVYFAIREEIESKLYT